MCSLEPSDSEMERRMVLLRRDSVRNRGWGTGRGRDGVSAHGGRDLVWEEDRVPEMNGSAGRRTGNVFHATELGT